MINFNMLFHVLKLTFIRYEILSLQVFPYKQLLSLPLPHFKLFFKSAHALKDFLNKSELESFVWPSGNLLFQTVGFKLL